MKCSACGEENAPNAKFCPNCGTNLSVPERPPEDESGQNGGAHTAQPTSDNPFQPRRMPNIYADDAQEQPAAPKESLPHKPLKVFLFEDEREEEARRQKRLEDERRAADDPFYGEEDDEEEDDDDDNEPSGRGGRIFAIVISLVTVLILIGGAFVFLFYTPIGSRLRAYYGFASNSSDYVYLAEWQRQNGNDAEAAVSYYNAFLLNRDDYAFALQTAKNFEQCGAYERAEQMYLYLIDKYPDEDDPYDYLMALLFRENKEAEYNALIDYRTQRQPGYTPSENAPLFIEPPKVDPDGGVYDGHVRISLSAAEGAEIHFTVDGKEPGVTSQLYTKPITLYSGSYTLRAVALMNGILSDTVEVSYIIR